MTLYMKRFVYASLFYLGLAAVFGILDGTVDLGYFGSFAHTHFSLLGFMAMIVFGIGYFILPRFNGTELRFENWVPPHFWLANISLVGMVVFRGLTVETGQDLYHILFVIAASLQVISILMFVVNIWMTLTPTAKPTVVRSEAASAAGTGRPVPIVTFEKPAVAVNSESTVAYLVDTLPSLKEILIESGLRPLALPGHIDKVRANGVTLGVAARNHGIDLDAVIARIEEELRKNGFAISDRTDGGNGISASSLIGEVIRNYPGSRAAFQRHFGSGCFDCPGQAYESIDMACRMHGVDPERFLRELKETLT
jgi:hybrid cluster-associated redox disulfide protein